MSEISERIVIAHKKLSEARSDWLAAREAYVAACNRLDDAKTEVLVCGYVNARDAEERAAQLDNLVAPQIKALRAAAIKELEARLVMEAFEDALRVALAVAALHAKI